MQQTVLRLAIAAAAALYLSGCAPLLFGGAAAGTALVATDRRTAGTQVEDETIEVKVVQAIAGKIPRDYAHVNVTSYNRRVLLSGEVTTAQYKADAEKLAAAIDNVRGVVNELEVGQPSTFGARSGDTAITAKVRAALTTAKDVPSATIKVVTEREIVYLFGRVTDQEGGLAAKAASEVSGVKRVVKLFDILTPAELTALEPKPAPVAESQKK